MLSGKRDELVGKLQERYGITREQAMKEADEWASAEGTTYDAAHTHTMAGSKY